MIEYGGATVPAVVERRSLATAIRHGLMGRCPHCGVGRLFNGYLTVADHCTECGEAFHHHRADDAPPYITISIVGHLIVGLMLSVEVAWHPPLWVHTALWVPLTIISALVLLRPVKGAVIGLQWALMMHGFDPNAPKEDE